MNEQNKKYRLLCKVLSPIGVIKISAKRGKLT